MAHNKDRTESVFVYMTKEEKVQFEANRDNHELQLGIIKSIFQDEKDFLKTGLVQVEEELLKYRALLLTVRQEYFKAQNEHSDKLEEFWTEFYANLPRLEDKVGVVKRHLEPILTEAKAIQQVLNDVNHYPMEKMLGIVKMIQGLDTESVAMFHSLVENFKIKNP